MLVTFSGLLIIRTNAKPAAVLPNLDEEAQLHKVKFYDEKTFVEGIEKAKKITAQDHKIRGGIIPHHLLPGFIIADFFKRLSFQNPKTIILIGPNHYEKGNFKASISAYAWETPFGIVEPDVDIISELLGKNLVWVDEEVLPGDHSVSGSIPFIKYYLPEANVVPIILKGGFSQKDAEVLAENLKQLMNEDVVVVAVVDFSHYLTSTEAKEKDEVTLKIMHNFDYSKLYTLNNDFLDSPPSIAVLLMLMQKINATKSEILFHTNSGELQKSSGTETTSYFSLAYYGD